MTIKKEKPECLAIARNFLLDGEVIIIPTDTVYGFSGLIRDDAKEKLEKIKRRAKDKGFICLIDEARSALKYIDSSFYTKEEIDSLISNWPSPLTIIFKKKEDSSLAVAKDTIALRCPDDAWLKQLIHSVGSPIFSTSANLSGSPIIHNIRELEETFASSIPLIVDGGELTGNASTIVDASSKPFRVIREGSYIFKNTHQ